MNFVMTGIQIHLRNVMTSVLAMPLAGIVLEAQLQVLQIVSLNVEITELFSQKHAMTEEPQMLMNVILYVMEISLDGIAMGEILILVQLALRFVGMGKSSEQKLAMMVQTILKDVQTIVKVSKLPYGFV